MAKRTEANADVSGAAGSASKVDSSNHTPGPWAVGRTVSGKMAVWAVEDELGATLGYAFAEENAHLIAAAPELLEALRDLEEQARQVVHGERSGIDARLWTAAQQALIKAGAL